MPNFQSNDLSKRRIRTEDIVFAVLLALLTVLQLLRAPYGLDRADESYYLTVPYRFLQGDIPLVHEWNLGQLSGLLLTPVMWVYRLFGGTGEGMILRFRYIYVFFQSVTAVLIYLLLRKKSALGGLLAALIFVPFSPYLIMALSYNSMGIGLLLLAGLVLAYNERSPAFQTAAGVLFAMAVLCCPYLLALYLCWGVGLGIYAAVKKERSGIKGFLVFTAGAAAVALVLAVAILSRAGLREILAGLPAMLNDPEHTYLSLPKQTGKYFYHLLLSRKISLFAAAATAGIVVLGRLDRKRAEHRWLYVSAGAAVTAVFLLVVYAKYRYINYFMLPLTVLGAVCYLHDAERDRAVFRYVYLSGWVYSYLMILSSNNFYEALTASLTVSTVASAYFAGKTAEVLLQDKKSRKKLLAAGSAIACTALALVFTAASKLAYAHGTYFVMATFPTSMMNYTIDCGPARGIRIYDNEYVNYMNRYEQSLPVRQAKGENVLYITHDCWMYLADRKKNAAYSSWLAIFSPDNVLERLEEYREQHPEKLPDAVYIDKPILEHPEKFLALLDTGEYTVEESELAYVMIRNK